MIPSLKRNTEISKSNYFNCQNSVPDEIVLSRLEENNTSDSIPMTITELPIQKTMPGLPPSAQFVSSRNTTPNNFHSITENFQRLGSSADPDKNQNNILMLRQRLRDLTSRSKPKKTINIFASWILLAKCNTMFQMFGRRAFIESTRTYRHSIR